MKLLLKVILVYQWLIGTFLVGIGFIVGLKSGWWIGIKTFLLTWVLVQPAIILLNWRLIKDVLFSERKERSTK